MKFLKNIILCIITSIALIITGIKTINIKKDTEQKQSSYTLTDFDYLITSPSKEQIAELDSKSDAINSVFPCYSFDVILNGNSNSKVTLLLSDDIDDYSIGLFNDKTKISGNYNKNGICLDKIAANNLGVVVGDFVTVSLANKTFKFEVTSIYMSSTYTNLDFGLALAEFSKGISSAYGEELTYNYAFIDAKDLTKCAQLLSTYIPLGPLQSEEDYIKEYKNNNNCPPSMTENEWNQSIKNAYNEYKEAYLNQKFNGVVQAKAEYMQDVKEQVETQIEKINYICIGIAVVVLILYTVLSIAFINSNQEDDILKVHDGNANVMAIYYKITIFGTLAVALITALSLFIYGTVSQFLKSYLKIIISFSLPVLISIPFICIFLNKYKVKIDPSLKNEKISL